MHDTSTGSSRRGFNVYRESYRDDEEMRLYGQVQLAGVITHQAAYCLRGRKTCVYCRTKKDKRASCGKSVQLSCARTEISAARNPKCTVPPAAARICEGLRAQCSSPPQLGYYYTSTAEWSAQRATKARGWLQRALLPLVGRETSRCTPRPVPSVVWVPIIALCCGSRR